MYVAVQDTVTRTHFAQWLKAAAEAKEPQPIMRTARHLNMETSLRVFCGRHIPESAAREISDQYWDITRALQLVNFPLALPGTNVYRAVKARKVAMYWLELAARESKAAIASGRLPECLLEEWIQVLADPAHKGRKDFSDREMAMTVFSFLFASQDAMSSGLIYAFQHLADLPDVMQKVKEEQERVRKGSYNSPITIDMLDQMPYLQAFVKESLRIKPPVLMVCLRTECACESAETKSRSLTKPPRPSRSTTSTLSRLTAWLSPPFTTLYMIPQSTPSPTSWIRRGGSMPKGLQTRTPRTIWSGVLDLTVASASSMQR